METKNEMVSVASAIESLDKLAAAAPAIISEQKVFSKALAVADTITKIKEALNVPGVMDNVMKLMGTPLGFLTDRDKPKKVKKGNSWVSEDQKPYTVPEVVNAVTEGILMGFRPTNNEMNIIAGKAYGAKNGFTARLRNLPGLQYKIIPGMPESANGITRVKTDISWVYNGSPGHELIEFPIKDHGMGADASIGKAQRKAMAWLWNYLTGSEMPHGEAEDAPRIQGEPEAPRVSGPQASHPDHRPPTPIPSDCLTIRGALNQEVGAIFSVYGYLTDTKTDYKGKNKSPSTTYSLTGENNDQMDITVWGEAIKGALPDGDTVIIAEGVVTNIHNNIRYYNAKSVKV